MVALPLTLAAAAAAAGLLLYPPPVSVRQRVGASTMCAPLTTAKYGPSTLHVDLHGTRSVRRITSMPEQPPNSVRVVFVSDTHSQLDQIELPMGDVLCHTGDITFCSRGGTKLLKEFNEQLAELPHPHKIVIAGNHDRRLEQLGRFDSRELLTSAHYLENSGVTLCGLRFWGSPFSPRRKRRSSNTAFQYSEERQKRTWRYVPNDVDVLLTHGSAASPNGELLRIAISRISPWLHAHGHDHELHGATLEWDRRSTRPTRPPSKRRQLSDGSEGQGEQATRVDGSRIRPRLVTVNAAICNKRYEPVQLPVVVDLPKAPSRRLVHRGSTRAASASKSRRVPMRPGGRGNSTSATSAPHARGRGSAVRGGKGGAGAGGQAARRPAAEPVLSERGRGRTTQAQMGGSRMPNAAERRERRGAASRARNQSPGEAEE